MRPSMLQPRHYEVLYDLRDSKTRSLDFLTRGRRPPSSVEFAVRELLGRGYVAVDPNDPLGFYITELGLLAGRPAPVRSNKEEGR